jgi:Fic family protein
VPIPWNDDPPGSQAAIQKNCSDLLYDIVQSAPARSQPTVETVQDWHRRIYDGIKLPVPYYAGEVRDSDIRFPGLIGYEVGVAGVMGVPSAQVPQELAAFEQSAQRAVAGLDTAIPVGQQPSSQAELHAVVALCAVLHGEWIRIHPFANGNGRTARVWANWAAVRYALPPFVGIKPRPPIPAYELAGMSGMRGDHQTAISAFMHMLKAHLHGRPSP